VKCGGARASQPWQACGREVSGPGPLSATPAVPRVYFSLGYSLAILLCLFFHLLLQAPGIAAAFVPARPPALPSLCHYATNLMSLCGWTFTYHYSLSPLLIVTADFRSCSPFPLSSPLCTAALSLGPPRPWAHHFSSPFRCLPSAQQHAPPNQR